MFETQKAKRLRILFMITVNVILILVVRLLWLQFIHGPEYKRFSEDNAIKKTIVPATRGIMYDRQGAVLVGNRPSFAVSILPANYTNPQVTPILAKIIGKQPSEIDKMLEIAQEFPYTPVRIKRDVDQSIIAKIEENKKYLPGVMIEAIPVRQYVYKKVASQLFGYLGSIDEDEYSIRKKQGYHPSDLIGKDGLEKVYEEYLRGIDGAHEVEVNSQGEEVRQLGERPAKPGKAIVLTLDGGLQKKAEEILTETIAHSRLSGEPAKGGAVVILEVKTGAILTMVSQPSFDPNVFAGGITERNWNKIINDPHSPLTNRVIQSSFPPASVFKIVTSAAALELGATTSAEIFNDTGKYILEGWTFYGWQIKGLGKLNIADALVWSSDPVFYELGRRIGANRLADYALTFGFGQKTGINLPGEDKGFVPTIEWKQQTYQEPWLAGETIIAAIGQGYYLATPLQQALLAMAVANRGIVYRPMLVSRIQNNDGQVIKSYLPELLRTIYLKPEYWAIIRSGLEGVPIKGTAAISFKDYKGTLAGKTGSAETGRGTVHSWFACYAPADNPEIAMAVFVEDAGDGAEAAVPATRRILEYYFSYK